MLASAVKNAIIKKSKRQRTIKRVFLEFLVVEDATGLGLFNVSQDVLKSLDLDIKYVRGQGYDNGSNMKGKHQVSKKLQSSDVLLDAALKNLKGLVNYFENYRETGLDNAISKAKLIAETIDIEHEFTVKRVPCRFEQMKHFESIFGFMFDASKLAYLDDANLKECCLNLEYALTNDEACDIDGNDLFMELQILQAMLPNGEKPWSSIEIMEFTKKMDIERKPSTPSHPSNANERNSPDSYVFILKSGKTNNIMSDQQMMKGSDIEAQEKKAKLFNEWERFTSTDGESIESYYHRFSKLMNDFKRNKHFPEKIVTNLKFLNNLQPEWKRHITIVRQTKDLHQVDYTQLYDFLKMNQEEVNELRAE
ncbi:gag-pol polyprotein [Tanacetum coccineum]